MAGVNEEWQATGNAAMRSKAGARGSTGLTGLYSKGTGRNACRYLRLGDRRGRAENQPLLLGGVGLGRVARSIQAGQAFPPALSKYRPGGLYLLACRYLTPWRYAPLREMLWREAREVKQVFFAKQSQQVFWNQQKFFGRGSKSHQKTNRNH